VVKLHVVKKFNKRYLLICSVLVLVILARAMFLWNQNRHAFNLNSQKVHGNLQNSPKQKSTNQGEDQNQQASSSSLNLAKNLPQGVNAISLKSTGNIKGDATIIAVSDGDNFSLVVEAKLPDPVQGTSYFAWLEKEKGSSDLYKVGKLQKQNTVYALSFNKSGDFSAYKFVLVSSEINDDNKAETRVLEGALQK